MVRVVCSFVVYHQTCRRRYGQVHDVMTHIYDCQGAWGDFDCSWQQQGHALFYTVCHVIVGEKLHKCDTFVCVYMIFR